MDFQKLLLDVGKALSTEEVKALAFLCTDLLNRHPTSVELASDLFTRLADQDHISAERQHLLTELLHIIQRTRLIRNHDLPEAPTSQISAYRKLLYTLSEDLTEKDLKEVKFLLSQQLPRRKLEENVSLLEIFLEMEHMDLIGENNLNLLETILDSVCPMLKEKINQFKALQAQQGGRPRAMTFPLDPSQATMRTALCEMPEVFGQQGESSMNTSNTSVDLPFEFDPGEECEALSHGLSGLNTETSVRASLKANRIDRIDVSETGPPQENKAHSDNQMSPATNITTEVLETYPMKSAKRGVCLIINNNDFTKSVLHLREREGTKLDEECLHRVFKWLGFKVDIRRDCKKQEMLNALQELGSRDHSQVDCLVCCVLSHGEEGSVYGVDGHTAKIKDLKEPVNGSMCASLVEKPKLFFIQACQGTSEQRAVYIDADGPDDDSVYSDARKLSESIPSDADFLLAMATVPSYVSYRETKNGTWFIQSLCQRLVEMVPSGYDLMTILTKVNADVSQRTDSKGVKKQMPQPAFSLRKKVVFPNPSAPPPSLQL